jgi:hypothetical protein
MLVPHDEAAIRELLERKVAAWNARDFPALRALWDLERDPCYVPEEALKPCLSWSELDAYWADTARASQAIQVAIRDVVVRELAPNLAAALYAMHWDFQAAGAARPVGGDLRVYAVMRRVPAGWRFAQYVEAPLAPIVYMRTLYEQQVTAGFSGANR